MLITLFTPTHDTTHLDRLARSIERQTARNFEWLIVPNGPLGPDAIDASKLPQARVVPYRGATRNIGELKHFCCAHARGEVLAEVDHDDELTPECVAELTAAFGEDPELDFAFSNCCEITNGLPWTYSRDFGWEYRPFEWEGKPQLEMLSFDPSPASFSRIWYAPNHIRAWRRDFYHRIGGHDASLSVLDDHDLMARSYIHGKVKKIDKCLYIYHVHEGNTCRGEQNAAIQTGTLELYDKYIESLVRKWCEVNALEVVHLTAETLTGAWHEHWPLEDESVGLVLARDVLCKLPSPLVTMKEINRVLAPGGWLLSDTPSTDGRGAFQDPRHVSYWNINSFWYYTRKQHAAYIGTPVKFQVVRLENHYPNPWCEAHEMVYVRADLLKVSGRVPGPWDFRPAAPARTERPHDEKSDLKFTVLTPTVERETLRRCCASLDRQTYGNWQHLVVLDAAEWSMPLGELEHPNRVFLRSGERHHDVGNYCRHLAYEHIAGDFVLHLDDDNYLMHERVLENLNRELRAEDEWAVCPILFEGKFFFQDPPGRGRTDQSQLVYRPVIGGRPVRFPAIAEYDADGVFCEQLKALGPPRMLFEVGPIVIYERRSGGQ